MKKYILLFFSLSLALSWAEISVTSYVAERKIGLQDMLSYTIEISDNSDKHISQPTLPEISGFDFVHSSSSHSSSMQIINGRMNSSVTISYTYTLRPQKIGKFLIPPITFEIKGKKYTTDAISVEVVKGSTKSLPPSQSYRGKSQASSDQVEDNLFIVAEVSDKNVFEGEPLRVDYKIYTRYTIANLEFLEEPQFNGFWKEVISRAEYKQFTRSRYKGQIFNMMPLLSVALFPTQSGKLIIPELSMLVDVRVEPRSFFDFGSTKRFTVKSDAIPIQVKNIPSTGRPENFSGAVGQFSINSSISQTEMKVGDSFTYTLEISGKGNFSQFEQPMLQPMNHLRFLDPEITTKVNKDKISGVKTIKYLVIAQEKGSFSIPSLEFVYFDTKQKKFKKLRTKSYPIQVAEGQNLYIPSSSAQTRVLAEAKDIRFIITDTELAPRELYFRSFWYWFIGLIGLFSIPISLLVAKEQTKLAGDLDYIRQKKAAKIMKKYLKEATQAIKENKIEFYAYAQNGLSSYLCDKLQIPRGSTSDILLAKLEEKKIDSALLEDIKTFLTRCDEARFMPGGFSHEAIHIDFKQLKFIVQKVMKVL